MDQYKLHSSFDFRLMNDNVTVKMRETLDTFQNLYQIRHVVDTLLPENTPERNDTPRFSVVSLNFISD